MVRGRADGAAVLGHDAVGLLHAHEGELLHAAPHELSCFFVKRLDFVAFDDVNDIRFVIVVRAVLAPPAAAQARVARHALAGDRERAAEGRRPARLARAGRGVE